MHMNETTEPTKPYDAEMHCRKIAWMGKNGPDWDIENQTLEQYLETSADYPTVEQVACFNLLWVEPFVPVKREKYQGETIK
jgi:hypothetical protein